MPKPMLFFKQQNQTTARAENLLSATTAVQHRQFSEQEKLQLARLLRQKRSPQYMAALQQLDAGGHVQNQQQVQELVQKIKAEFPQVELQGLLLGVVALCYLGSPYEVHTLDFSGSIIEHYQQGRPLPGRLERARSLALHGGYAFIEVYQDCCRAVSENGTVAVVQG